MGRLLKGGRVGQLTEPVRALPKGWGPLGRGGVPACGRRLGLGLQRLARVVGPRNSGFCTAKSAPKKRVSPIYVTANRLRWPISIKNDTNCVFFFFFHCYIRR